MPTTTTKQFTVKAAIAVALSTSAIVLLAIMWFAADVLLVLFAGVLFAILVRGAAKSLSHWSSIPVSVSLVIVILLILVLSGGGLALVASSVTQEVNEIMERLPKSEKALREQIKKYGWGKDALSNVPSIQQMFSRTGTGSLVGRITGMFSTTLGAIANVFIVLAVGLYLAAAPRAYMQPLLRLLPQSKQGQGEEILNAIGNKLWYWLLGRTVAMAIVSIATGLGLWMLGIPGATALGLLAGLLNFIPNIGPLISLVPAALIALTVGPTQVLYVVVLYLVIQVLESYLFTPLIQKRTVNLQPAFTISMQVLLGVLLGFAGLALATPLTATAVLLVQELYLKPEEQNGRTRE